MYNIETSQEIVDYLIKSANTYFEWLTQNNKGVSRIKVVEVVFDKTLVGFRLAAPLKFTEHICLEIDENNYSLSEVHAYRKKERLLICSVLQETRDLLSHGNWKNHILNIKSDLRFLVQRVGDRYLSIRRKNVMLMPPAKASELPCPTNSELLFPASDNQLQAIEKIFTKPYSYVWGAPGTGKTRCVLLNSIVQYIRAGKQIIVAAPTNNALDQILESILPELESGGLLTPTAILRLGTPSESFARRYPAFCEKQHTDVTVTEWKNAIEKLKNLLHLRKAVEQSEEISYKVSTLLNKAIVCNEIIKNAEKDLQKYQKEHNESCENLIKISSEKERIERRADTNKLYKHILNSPLPFYKKDAKKLEQLILASEALTKQIQEKEIAIDNVKKIIAARAAEEPDAVAQVKKELSESCFLSAEITNLLNLRSYNQVLSALNTVFVERKNQLTLYHQSHPNFATKTTNEIKKMLQSATDTVSTFEQEHETVTIKNANIIACTMDTLIHGVYSEQELLANDENDTEDTFQPAHIFLDEAAYCCLAKAALLFAFNCPITLLGDHKQLPPVCEFSEGIGSTIQQAEIIEPWNISSIYLKNAYNEGICNLSKAFLRNHYTEDPCVEIAPLTETFRFGSSLTGFLQKWIYKNGLRSVKAEDTDVYYAHAEPQAIGKRQNLGEVHCIKKLLNSKILQNTDYAILTPYKNQIKLLQEYFPDLYMQSKILTVHKSQGNEWETVILSVVDNRECRKFFTSSKIPQAQGLNLMNTALSRTQKNIILVLDTEYWKSQDNEFLTDILSIAKPWIENID